MSFFETQFDPAISNGAVGGPMFKTSVVSTNSGNELRNADWTYPLHQYDVANGLKTQAQIDSTKALFMNVKGKAYGFRFKDWADYLVVTTNSSMTKTTGNIYQLNKNYVTGASTLSRAIKKPVTGTVLIYKDAVLLTLTTDYSIDYTTGLVTFVVDPTGHTLTWAGQFDVPVRFDTDVLHQTIDSFNNFSWSQIMMVELRNP